MAKSWANLEKKYGYILAVVDCPHFAEPEIVIANEWTSEEVEEEKSKRTYSRKKKIDDEGENEGDG
jgi:hypothetical protein